jgi:hypothetical protein
MYNMAGAPLEFRMANVQAAQLIEEQHVGLQVIPYEELVREEKRRQTAQAVGVSLAAVGNAMSASQAGSYSAESTITSSSGRTYQVSTTGYSPTAAAIAQSNAAAQNEAMISSTIEQGRRNLAGLERSVLKDNTLLPGEWYGGTVHLQRPASVRSGSAKIYSISLLCRKRPTRNRCCTAGATVGPWRLA